MMYHVLKNGKLLESHEDLVDALVHSRKLAEKQHAAYEVRNDDDIVLAVSVEQTMSSSSAMGKAVRHNLERGTEIYRVYKPDTTRPFKNRAWGKR